MDGLAGYLEEWAEWMQAGGMSQRTIDARTQLLLLFAARTGGDPVTADWKLLTKFLSNDAFSAGTRATYQAHLRQWFYWLIITDVRADNPVDKLHRVRTPRRTPRPITTAQLHTLLTSGIYRRTRTMILLAAYQGFRVHEIALMRGDLVFGQDLWVIGKGGVEDKLPLHPLVEAEVSHYPRARFWFPSPDDRTVPILAKSVSNVISKAMGRAGVPGTAHSLRHWFGTELLESADGNLRVAQTGLRHAWPTTTAIYTKIHDEDLRLAVNRLPGTLRVVS